MNNTKKNEEPPYFLVKIFLDRLANEHEPTIDSKSKPNPSKKVNKLTCESFQKEYYNCMISPEPTCLPEFENLTKCIKELK
jgi:hypothetical protein